MTTCSGTEVSRLSAPVAVPQRPGEVPQLAVTSAELRQLSAFLDGAIMDAGVRHQLWRGWGLCPRHSWAYVLIEIERAGGRPFSATILLEDLLARAVHRVRVSPTARLVVRGLRSRGSCVTCDYVAISGRAASRTEPGDPVALELLDLHRSSALLRESWSLLQTVVCADCGAGTGPACRLHLLRGGALRSRAELSQYLDELHARVAMFLRSMTWRGPEVGPAEESSWVEAMGWFYGWAVVLAVTTQPTGGEEMQGASDRL